MVALLALAVMLPRAGAVQGGLPSWVDALGAKEDPTRVDRRVNAATNVRLRPAAVSLKVLLAEVNDYAIFLAPLGGKIPAAFRAGVTPQTDRTTGATQYRRETGPRSRVSEYWTSRSGAAISMSDAYADTRARIRADFERDARSLKRRLGFPNRVTRNDERATLLLVWQWSDETTLSLTLDAHEATTSRIRIHLGR